MTEPIMTGIYPVYVYENGMELPTEGTYYVLAGNGNFLHKDTGVVKGLIPVKHISVLDDFNSGTSLCCKLPKVPFVTAWKIKEFFKAIVAKFRSESEINLYYNKDTQEFRVHVPTQKVGYGSVEYLREGLIHQEGMKDFLRVGTIHSHCDFGAFHSHTDVDDEDDFDGIHITFGHNNQDIFTISATVAMNGHRCKIDPLDAIEGIEHVVDDSYQFSAVALQSAELNMDAWNIELDQWMKPVSHGSQMLVEASFVSDQKTFAKGNMIKWKDQTEASKFWTNTYGNGPFEVIGTQGNKVSIMTKIGVQNIIQVMFVKDTNEKDTEN